MEYIAVRTTVGIQPVASLADNLVNIHVNRLMGRSSTDPVLF